MGEPGPSFLDDDDHGLHIPGDRPGALTPPSPHFELALLGAPQIERLVLVPGGLAGETGLDGTLATAYAGMSVPLLVVRRGLPPAEALPLLRQFLEQKGATAAVG